MWDSLIVWSKKEFTHLPWRQKRTLYKTLVSEIMLQQTTVGTVLNHFDRFINEFPDLRSLALATEDELLVAWKGLGYYRRAKNLKKIAEIVYKEFDGEIPSDINHLMAINGIGPYTANALVAIGMDQRGLAVDANLERVLARYYGLETPKGPKLQKQIQQLFLEKKICHEKKVSFRALNEALMDLGRTICQANRVACELCPIKKECVAFKNNKALSLPKASALKSSQSEKLYLNLLRVVVEKEGKVLAYKKNKGEWLEGQWELPTFIIQTNDEGITQYPRLGFEIDDQNLPKVKTGITKYDIINYVVKESVSEFKKYKDSREMAWLEVKDKKSNLSTASMKCIEKVSSP